MPTAEILLQTSVGVFFALSGYHKLFNVERRATLRATLAEDLPKLKLPAWCLEFMLWWLPCWELGAGGIAAGAFVLHLAGVGIVAKLAMVPLLVIMLVALYCEGAERVREYQPIDGADVVDDWLYLPETLLGVMALAAILA